MIVGVNSDVRYKGKTFHIQTEDSGPKNPVIITHLFVGGTILVSEKEDYDALAETHESDPEFDDKVRERMRTQHKKVYEALLRGVYDEIVRRPPQQKSAIPLARDKRKKKRSRAPDPSADETTHTMDGDPDNATTEHVLQDVPETDADIPMLESMEAFLIPEDSKVTVRPDLDEPTPPPLKREEAGEVHFPPVLITDDPLDEVILGYLAEDGE
jgi:hypothetical protein